MSVQTTVLRFVKSPPTPTPTKSADIICIAAETRKSVAHQYAAEEFEIRKSTLQKTEPCA
jgi:hypothetical protein